MITKEKGITLVALVITIIILLILAGVALSVVLGENGLISKTKNGTEIYQGKALKETVDLCVINARINENLSLDLNLLDSNLKEKFGTGNYTVTVDNENNRIQINVKEENFEYSLDGSAITTGENNNQIETGIQNIPYDTPEEINYYKQGLVLWLDGNQNTRSGHNSLPTKWEDLSGNNYDATINGNCKFDNNSIFMDGNASDNVTVFGSEIVDALNDTNDLGYTISMLVRTKATNGIGFLSCGKSNETCKKLHLITRNGSKFYFAFYNNDYEAFNYSEYNFKYTTIDCVYTSGTKKVYVNGTLIGSASSGKLNIDSSSTLYIGKDTANNYYLNGNVASVKIYNVALTDEQIADNASVNEQLIQKEKVRELINLVNQKDNYTVGTGDYYSVLVRAEKIYNELNNYGKGLVSQEILDTISIGKTNCIQNNKNEYITDGLVLWLDGIQNTRAGHSTTANVWEDLSGNNYDFTKINSNATVFTVGDNKLTFNNTSGLINNQIIQNTNLKNGYVTIEIVAYTNNGGEGTAIALGRAEKNKYLHHKFSKSNIRFGWYNNDTLESYTSGIVYAAETYDYDFYRDDIKINSTYKRTSRTDGLNISDTTNASIGAYSTDSERYIGDIYCIRVYDRALSEDELNFNYAIDKVRFEF